MPGPISGGSTFNPASPGAIGGTTPAAITGTTLTATATFVAPAGTILAPSVSVGTAGKGLFAPDSTHIQIQAATDGSAMLYLGGGYIITGAADRFRFGYQNDVTANAFQVYYPGCGGSVVGSGEWYLSSGAARVFDLLTAGVRVVSGKTLTLGNAATTGLTAGVLAALTNASITITDSTGQLYRVPCII